MADASPLRDLAKFLPSSPVVYFIGRSNNETSYFTLECRKLDISVECYVSNGIISMQGIWFNSTDHKLDCVFALPTTGTVSSVQVTLKSRPGVVITSAVVSDLEAERIAVNSPFFFCFLVCV